MRKAGGHPYLAPIGGRNLSAHMLPKCRRADSDIHGHIQNCAANHAYEFPLIKWRYLKMQAPHGSGLGGKGVVILYEPASYARRRPQLL